MTISFKKNPLPHLNEEYKFRIRDARLKNLILHTKS